MSFLQRSGFIFPDKTAVVHGERRYTYSQFAERVNRLASRLRAIGLQKQERAFAEGWFHSGDLAVWHPDGYIELRDRAKDIIISGGENISTIEVEQAIVKHPAVLECAVVAIPDETWGERPKAFVTLRENHQATEADIVAFCREYLAHFKCHDTVEFGELPKTSMGKVQKYVLREREWAGRGKHIN